MLCRLPSPMFTTRRCENNEKWMTVTCLSTGWTTSALAHHQRNTKPSAKQKSQSRTTTRKSETTYKVVCVPEVELYRPIVVTRSRFYPGQKGKSPEENMAGDSSLSRSSSRQVACCPALRTHSIVPKAAGLCGSQTVPLCSGCQPSMEVSL